MTTTTHATELVADWRRGEAKAWPLSEQQGGAVRGQETNRPIAWA